MYKNCTTEQSALRQQQLEDCFLKNMLLRPYAEITISDLCEQSSISRKSFYRYFTNKDSCLASLLDRMTQHIINEEHSFLKQIGVTDLEHTSEPLLFATSGFVILLLNWAQGGFQKPAEEMAATITDLFTHPLIPDTGKG